MSNDNLDNTVDVLNDLIETSKDGEAGFRSCAEDVKSLELKTVFNERALECDAAADELQALVVGLGGEPEDDQSVLGKAHNMFVDLKAAVLGHDEKAIVNEVERGEDFIKAKFEKALAEDDLPATVREVVSRAFADIKSDHDSISALKKTLN